MDNWIENDEIVFDCGCTFPIVSRDPLRWKVPTDVAHITKHCKRTWDLFATGNTKGVFQLETRFGQQYSKKLMPESIEHLSGLVAILRPGALNSVSDGKSVTDRYIDRKNNREDIDIFHEALKPILESTYGLLTYQEQSLSIAKDLAGFSLQEAELLRKSVSKKKADLMAQIKEEFIEGCIKTGIVDKDAAETIFGWIEASQRYQFNKCLSPTTTVNTPSDIKTIADISIGDEVEIPRLGSKKEGVHYSRVVNKYDQGIQKVWDVYFEDFSITCTINHKFLCDDRTVRPLWHILLNNKHVVTNSYGEDCYSRITNIVDAGFQQTYDIEIEDERHLFYGNGIATSNSHSVSYAYNSYLSAYMKAHFPASFFTSYLFYAKDKQNRFEEAKLLINNARAMGIDVLPPDFRLDNTGFKRFDHQPKNANYYDLTADKVHFGFCDIKGVGRNKYNKFAKALDIVETYLGETRDKWDWMTFLIYLSQEIESTLTIALIESGALDYFKVSRSKMLFEYEQFSTMTSKEVAWIKQNISRNSGMTLTSVLETCILKGSGKGTCFANKNRLAKAQETLKAVKSPPYSLTDSPDWIARIEEARLGVSITCSLLDSCKNQDQANCSIRDFKSGTSKKNGLFIAGQVEEVKIILTRKGDEMAFLTLTDNGDNLDCVIFQNQWAKIKNKGICVVENCIMITGERSKDKDSFMVNDAFQLT